MYTRYFMRPFISKFLLRVLNLAYHLGESFLIRISIVKNKFRPCAFHFLASSLSLALLLHAHRKVKEATHLFHIHMYGFLYAKFSDT